MSSSVWYSGSTKPFTAEYLESASEVLNHIFDDRGMSTGDVCEHNKHKKLKALSRKYPGVVLDIYARDDDGDQWREKFIDGRFYASNATTTWSKWKKC